MKATTGQCTVCKQMIHKRRSGVHGDLSRVDNGFMCRRCDGTSQEADLVGGWRDIWMCKEFCYLGDTLDGNGRADLAATARIRNGRMKFRGRFPFLTSRAPPLESSVCQLRQKQHDFGK